MVQKVNDMGCQSNPRLQRTHSSARFDHCCGCPVRRLARTMPNPYAPYSVVSCMSAYVFLESGGTSSHRVSPSPRPFPLSAEALVVDDGGNPDKQKPPPLAFSQHL